MEFEQLITLIKTVSDSELTGFRYEENGVSIRLNKEKKKPAVLAGIPAAEATVAEVFENKMEKPAAVKEGNYVKSPLVGTFYVAPAEDAAPFVSVGDVVKKGQTLAIEEAMKLMNEIESEYDGIVEEVLVENGQAVEYGQPLFRIV